MKIVGVMVDGEPSFHAGSTGVADYDTLCMIDANDSKVGHDGLIDVPKRQKITCANCFVIWHEVIALKLRRSDFTKDATSSRPITGKESSNGI